MSEEWLNVFSQEEIENIETRANRIEEDMSTVYEVSFVIPRDQAKELCLHYYNIEEEDAPLESLKYIASLLTSLIGTIETALEMDGINPYDD